MMNKIEVCLTPELIHQHELEGKIVVVVDIFRATSCIVSGLSGGLVAIKPLATVEETFEMGKLGYVMAGERGGQKVDGFDIGNSPFEYLNKNLVGRKIAISTTNGTRTIFSSLEADEILVGAFLNLSATAAYLKELSKNVLIHCAGWKGTVNVEDTLYAGALIDTLRDSYEITGDAAVIASHLYQTNKSNLLTLARQSGHAHRLSGLGVKKDIEYCLRVDEFDRVIVLKEEHLIKL